MTIQIQSDIKVSEHLDELIRQKMEKLQRMYDRIERATVYLRKGDGTGTADNSVHIRLAVPGPDIYAESDQDSFEKAVADASDKVRRQLLRMKEQLSDRH